jgi:hypothetical protein
MLDGWIMTVSNGSIMTRPDSISLRMSRSESSTENPLQDVARTRSRSADCSARSAIDGTLSVNTLFNSGQVKRAAADGALAPAPSRGVLPSRPPPMAEPTITTPSTPHAATAVATT